jgi:hypothetical protein
VVFDQNTLAGDWRAQVRYCKEQDIGLHRDIAFALAVADLLDLPDDLRLLPAVTAAMPIATCLGDSASLARLKAVARSAGARSAATFKPPLTAARASSQWGRWCYAGDAPPWSPGA